MRLCLLIVLGAIAVSGCGSKSPSNTAAGGASSSAPSKPQMSEDMISAYHVARQFAKNQVSPAMQDKFWFSTNPQEGSVQKVGTEYRVKVPHQIEGQQKTYYHEVVLTSAGGDNWRFVRFGF